MAMKKFYQTEHYLTINNEERLNMYGCLSRERLHYGEMPYNGHIEFDNIVNLKYFIDCHGNQFYNKRMPISKRSYVKYDDGWCESHIWWDKDFKFACYDKIYSEVDLSNMTIEYLMNNLCAEDFAAWLKDNGIVNCPIISK